MNREVPKGFVEKGIAEMRRCLIDDLRNGGRGSDNHYTTIAMDSIWEAYVKWKNLDSNMPDGWRMSSLDMAAGCRRRKLAWDMDSFDINIVMEHHSYRFTYCFGGEMYGGPVDGSGIYPGTFLSSDGIRMTARTFFKLLSHFDNVIDSAVPAIREVLGRICSEFRTQQVMAATLGPRLEPGLEDLSYRYTCVSDDKGDRVLVYLFDLLPSRFVVELPFSYDAMLKNIGTYRNVIRNLCENPLEYKNYAGWAVKASCDPSVPPKSTTKRF